MVINFLDARIISRGINFFKKYKNIIFGVASIFICSYLFYGSGLHGDDISQVTYVAGSDFSSFLNSPKLVGLGSYYLFSWAYYFVRQDELWIYDIIKCLSCSLSLLLVYRFSLDYLPRDRAFLAALLFVFNPVHEVTLYWYMTLSYMLAPAIIMMAHHLVRKEKYCKGFFVGCAGSFMGYMSPPYGIGLAVIFLLEKSYKKALIFISPALIYIAYYFSIFILKPYAETRVPHGISIDHLLNNYLLQFPAAFDALIGPSFLLKVYYSIKGINFLSFILALLVILFMIKNLRTMSSKIPFSLIGGLIAVLILSFAIFAIANIIGHRAFNLGDRLSVFGSLLIAFLLVSMPLSRSFLTLIAFCFVLPTFGLSDHWKAWNVTQNKIINRVKNNQDLRQLSKNDTLLVSGDMFSKLGPFSHIDFFNMPWNVDAIFKNVVVSENIVPLNTYVRLDGHRLIDDKSSVSVEIIKDIYLYRTCDDSLIKISPEQLPDLLASRPVEIRHWAQLVKGSYIASFIRNLSPRFAAVIK